MFERIAKLLGGDRLPDPPDRLIYAVGDIHGRCDLLRRLTGRIAEDAESADGPAEIIFIGDYIDRGPASADVVEFLLHDPVLARFERTFLKGNHEAALLDFLKDSSAGPAWARFGGLDTLVSYGVRPPALTDREDWERARRDLAGVLPDDHRDFYATLQLAAERGCYFFVHAGVNPHAPIAEQSEAEFLWIREAFLDHDGRLARIVVHGHTPAPEPVWDHRRIGLDTGAYASGRLTAARIDGRDVRFITT